MNIGTAASQALEKLTASPQSCAKLPAVNMNLRVPSTVEECVALKKWADEQSDVAPSASTSEIARHLEFLAATLPARGVDVETAKMRFAVYSRFLGDFSNDALAFMARRVCEEYDWFPTPRQCLEILREYRPPVSNKEIALSYCHTFWQARFEEFISALEGGLVIPDMLADQPERWKLIAAERGYLRRMDDGSFIIRVRKELSADEEQVA